MRRDLRLFIVAVFLFFLFFFALIIVFVTGFLVVAFVPLFAAR